MARYFGRVGYAIPQEIRPGIWEDQMVEKTYYGDISTDTAKWRQGEQIHDKITASNKINIVADAYAEEHIYAMRYIEWSNALWVISEVVVERPRLKIRLGGLYNGPRAL